MLSAPMVVSFDLSTLNSPKQNQTKDLLLNKEIIAVDQDPDVVMASKVYTEGRNPLGADVWIKPLHDGTWAVALVNCDPEKWHNISVDLSGSTSGDFYAGPTTSHTASVRDLAAHAELGKFTSMFSVAVPPMDGRLFKFTF